ncbi:MAG: class I SAM-dependent methyltransferase [Desulfomonile tiedjei]|nr:class I SAM-dependent methyltransferase [Desulfomonile tiedjei]
MKAAQLECFHDAYVASAAAAETISTIDSQAFDNVDVMLRVFAELGRPVNTDDAILDFGCGEGGMVYAFRKRGFKAFGVDIAPPSPAIADRLETERLSHGEKDVLRVIPSEPYRIPFDDNQFDFVVSWDVMEHVQDHKQALAEIKRVLKPCGRSLHFFPARYRVLEPHVYVPFGTLLQGPRYLYFWALMGIRTESQRNLTAREVAQKNYEFLKTQTKYLTKNRLTQLVCGYFGNIDFVERHFWKHNGGKSGTIYSMLSKLGLRKVAPLAADMLSPFGHRALFFFKPPSPRPGPEKSRDTEIPRLDHRACFESCGEALNPPCPPQAAQ